MLNDTTQCYIFLEVPKDTHIFFKNPKESFGSDLDSILAKHCTHFLVPLLKALTGIQFYYGVAHSLTMHAREFFMLWLRSASCFFFLYKKSFKITITVNPLRIWIRTNIMLVLIWVQTVCKDYQRTTKVAASEERIMLLTLSFSFLGPFGFGEFDSSHLLRLFDCCPS